MRQKELAVKISLLNHTIKLKQLGILLERRQANKERTKKYQTHKD
jgi:hypothetical protein